MTGQPYRVIADRDRGDDMDTAVDALEDGDRVTYIYDTEPPDQIVRIERPVPTTDDIVAEMIQRNAMSVQMHGDQPKRDPVPVPRYILEDLEECVRSGTRHADAADAAWALLHPGAQL